MIKWSFHGMRGEHLPQLWHQPLTGRRKSAQSGEGSHSGGARCSRSESSQRFSASRKLLSVGRVFEAKKFALRHGVWFRALNRIERAIVDLTVKYVAVDVKSSKLAGVLAAILEKLQLAAESVVDKMVRSIGFAQARKVSEIAIGWGNRFASAWARDLDLARFLAVMHLNGSGIFRA